MEGDTLIMNTNQSCWAGITKYYIGQSSYNTSKGLTPGKEIIYVAKFREKETEEYIPLLIRLINKITPCEIVTIDEQEYVKITLLPRYDQSLIILNFLRNLWSCPSVNSGSFNTPTGKKYIPIFFETLKLARLHRDPLKRLLHANLEACKAANVQSGIGHSNINPFHLLKLKTKEELLAYEGKSTSTFLTQANPKEN
jgi:hypothetical protein